MKATLATKSEPDAVGCDPGDDFFCILVYNRVTENKMFTNHILFCFTSFSTITVVKNSSTTFHTELSRHGSKKIMQSLTLYYPLFFIYKTAYKITI